MPVLQDTVIALRRLVPRGWSPLLILLSRCLPGLRRYPARLQDGTTLYLDLYQRMCHGLLFMRGQPHEYGTEKAIRGLLSSGDTFIDVGANAGFYTAMASRVVGAHGRVIAVEPQPAALQILLRNASALGGNVSVVAKAASNFAGEAKFFVRQAGDTSSLSEDRGSVEISVAVDSIDNICRDIQQVNFIKIDVEGHELDVLEGAHATIAKHRPWVCFELLFELADSGRVCVDKIAKYFRDLGYVCNWVSHAPDRPLLTEQRSTYVLASPSERLGSIPFVPPPALAEGQLVAPRVERSDSKWA